MLFCLKIKICEVIVISVLSKLAIKLSVPMKLVVED